MKQNAQQKDCFMSESVSNGQQKTLKNWYRMLINMPKIAYNPVGG
jgi:hypothetical protein